MASISPGAFASPLGAPLDMLVDPQTLDYVRADDGSWVETPTSQTAVMAQLSIRYGTCFLRPKDGSLVGAALDRGEPITPMWLEAETTRSLNVMAGAGLLSNINVVARDEQGRQLVDERGRPAIATSFNDIASSSPVSLVLTPLT